MATTDVGKKTAFQKVVFFLKLLEIRLRFVAVLLVTALIVGYWDTIQNYWERWTRPSPQASAGHTQSETEFFCPMHPFVIRETMGKCPICGMDLIQRKKGAQQTLPEGTIARVQVSPERVMQAGVKVEPIGYRELTRTVDGYGTVEFDESRLSRVTARFPGRVEEIYIESPGVLVKKDQPLAKIYSPKYLAATLEFVQAVQAERKAQADPTADAESKRYATELADISRRPLERQGFTKEQLDEIKRTEKTTDRITLPSPVAGTVVEKNVVAGDNVDEGTVLYSIADLSTVWVLAQIAESDLTGLKAGLPVDVTAVAHPGETFHGTVDLIYPSVNPENRTVKVRVKIANEDAKLKPGMYVTIGLRTAVTGASQQANGTILSIPESAVIDTGLRKVVYVESSSGVYDARAVTLGARAGDQYPIIKGLSPGTRSLRTAPS